MTTGPVNGYVAIVAAKAQLQSNAEVAHVSRALTAVETRQGTETIMATVDPPATYGNGVHEEQLYRIKVPTQGGPIWLTHVGDVDPHLDHHKDLKRPLAASNVKEAAGAWPKAVAEIYLKEARKMWICAVIRRAE